MSAKVLRSGASWKKKALALCPTAVCEHVSDPSLANSDAYAVFAKKGDRKGISYVGYSAAAAWKFAYEELARRAHVRRTRELLPARTLEWIKKSQEFEAKWLRKHCKEEPRFRWGKQLVAYVYQGKFDGKDEALVVVEPRYLRALITDNTVRVAETEYDFNAPNYQGLKAAVNWLRGYLAACKVNHEPTLT